MCQTCFAPISDNVRILKKRRILSAAKIRVSRSSECAVQSSRARTGRTAVKPLHRNFTVNPLQTFFLFFLLYFIHSGCITISRKIVLEYTFGALESRIILLPRVPENHTGRFAPYHRRESRFTSARLESRIRLLKHNVIIVAILREIANRYWSDTTEKDLQTEIFRFLIERKLLQRHFCSAFFPTISDCRDLQDDCFFFFFKN